MNNSSGADLLNLKASLIDDRNINSLIGSIGHLEDGLEEAEHLMQDL